MGAPRDGIVCTGGAPGASPGDASEGNASPLSLMWVQPSSAGRSAQHAEGSSPPSHRGDFTGAFLITRASSARKLSFFFLGGSELAYGFTLVPVKLKLPTTNPPPP